jgi:DNA-directed RNA polymerase sigma subunit (sigma70/sigma32)
MSEQQINTGDLVQRAGGELAHEVAVGRLAARGLTDLTQAPSDGVIERYLRNCDKRIYGSSSCAPEIPSLDELLHEIHSIRALSANEEKELAYKIEEGNSEARHQMLRANLRLVVDISRTYESSASPVQRLIDSGMGGLCHAVEGFDPGENIRFAEYAGHWIKDYIELALENAAEIIRIPPDMVELAAKWRRATNILQTELGRPPTNEDVARFLGLPKETFNIIKKALRVYNEMVAGARSKAPDDAEEQAPLDKAVPRVESETLLNKPILTAEEQAVLNIQLTELNLSVRSRKCLHKLEVSTVGDLVQRTADELLEAKSFGMTCVNEVRDRLAQMGLKLRGD